MSVNRMLNVVIASPGDVVIERKIVSEVCTGLNGSELLRQLGISIHTAMWEDKFPSAEQTRTILNRLSDECDILVCVLYKRLDSYPGRTEADTLNEFLSAFDSWRSLKKPHFMFFFKEVKVSSLQDLRDPQLNKVFELKDKIKGGKRSYMDGFSAPSEFCEKVYDHMEAWVRENLNKH